MKDLGKPCTGEPYARIDEGGLVSCDYDSALQAPPNERGGNRSVGSKGAGCLLFTLSSTSFFGSLPVWSTQRLDAAPVAQLDVWLDAIFDAAGVEELIGDDAAQATPVRLRLCRTQDRREGSLIDQALHVKSAPPPVARLP